MEKTAVEWLVENIIISAPINWDTTIVEKAKQMENAQRKNDFRAGWHGNKHKDWNCEFYLIKHINNDFKSK